MKLFLKHIFLLGFLVAFASPAVAASPANTVIMQIDSQHAVVDGAVNELQTAPSIRDGVTLVPLRFIVEVFGAEVVWNTADKEITLRQGERVIRFWPGSSEVVVDGTVHAITGAPVVENGVTLVPLRFLVKNLDYEINFLPVTKEIHIKQLPPPNLPPVAEFEISNDTVAQGETVYYKEKSFDPDGDELVESKWSGRERAFFAPGDHEVSLQVKDKHGAWSEPYTVVIRVTDEVKMDEITYNLHNPIAGQPLNMADIPVLEIKPLDPVVMMNKEKIMISNSPETLQRDGILYSDVLSGENRLYYHHLNGSNKTKSIYLLAVNQGTNTVDLTVNKWGVAGPADPLAVGRLAAHRYLNFKHPDMPQSYKLLPGEKVILNEGSSNVVKPGQTTHGIFGVNADNDLLFAVVAAGSREQLAEFEKLPVLARDGKHIRGTYLRANRNVAVRLNTKQPARLVVADGDDDSFLYGKDEEVIYRNKGNYGLIYRINIQSKYRVGVLFSARGGVFAGAGAWQGEAFNLPNQGILKAREGCVIGIVEPGQERTLEFIPPAGSYLPINLIFIPF
ncbi:MAG: copper amine oxidase N-terminal domain-containing protein [Firmicutes bacterium]|nr:copper amine oxidase N-terminal domain-containing protein [Bacillota bacterium]